MMIAEVDSQEIPRARGMHALRDTQRGQRLHVAIDGLSNERTGRRRTCERTTANTQDGGPQAGRQMSFLNESLASVLDSDVPFPCKSARHVR